MKMIKSIWTLCCVVGLVALISSGVGARLRDYTPPRGSVGLEVPGQIADLPVPSPATYEPLSPADTRISSRQALDVAEARFGLTDGNIDPVARAVPVIVSIGFLPAYQHRKAWIVTVNRDTYNHGPARRRLRAGQLVSAPRMVKHKLCVMIDAITGQFVIAYNAGPIDIVH